MIQQTLFESGLTVFSVFIGNPIELRSLGDRRRAAQLALLNVLLRSRTGTACTDDIVRDSSKAYDDGGKWLGPAIRELQDDGLIRQCGANRSKRESRNGGLLNRWEIADESAARTKVRRLRAGLSFHKKTGSIAATIEPANEAIHTQTTDEGNLNHESK
jgi:hypothetical protein